MDKVEWIPLTTNKRDQEFDEFYRWMWRLYLDLLLTRPIPPLTIEDCLRDMLRGPRYPIMDPKRLLAARCESADEWNPK